MSKTPFWRTAWAIMSKDLRAELRSRELVSAMLLFTLLAIMIFSFALELDRITREEVVSGVLWVTVVFASILGLNRSMAMEREQGNMDAMLLAPIDRSAIFAGKMAGNFIFTLVVGVVLLPLTTVLYNVPVARPMLALVLLLGIWGFSTVGTLLAAMTVQTRARETLLPIVMLPVVLPLLLAAVRASNGIIADAPAEQWQAWPQVLLVIDVIYLVMCLLMFPYVVEE